MKKVLIIGEASKAVVEYLQSKNYQYWILQDLRARRVNPANLKMTTVVDFMNEEELVAKSKELMNQQNFDVSICEFENYIYQSFVINKACGLPGLNEFAANACTDKEKMRAAFASASFDISPNFIKITTEQEVLHFAKSHGYPVVIKAAGLAKSLLVVICDDEETLKLEYTKMSKSVAEIYSSHAPLKQPKLIIEEFMAGSIHSVEGFADSAGNVVILPEIVDCISGKDVGQNDNYHYMLSIPSYLSNDERHEAYKVAAEGMQSLQMTNSAAHIEFIMTNNGPRLIEIGARDGGYRPRMHQYANDFDLYEAWFTANMGKLPEIIMPKNSYCTEFDFVSQIEGRFVAIKNAENLRTLKSFKNFSVMCKPGEMTGRASDGYRPSGFAIIANDDFEQYSRDLEYIRNNVEVIVESK